MKNPFNYMQFATGEHFYDRAEIRKDLVSRLTSGQTNVVLYGPRRYGKTSLVAEVMADLEKKGLPCVAIDIIKVPTIELFAQAYATAVYRKLAPVKLEFRKLGEFLKSLRPRLILNSEGEPSLAFDSLTEQIDETTLTEVLNLPQKLLGNSRKRAVIIFDEFQEVSDILPDNRFERVMRSVIQSQDNVSYIFLGSRYHMLRRMFTDHNRPFYKSAITMLLDKPPAETSIEFARRRFESGGIKLPLDLASRLVSLAENIPYYVQQIGFEVFRLVDDDNRHLVTPADLERAFQLLSSFNRDQYEQLMLTFSTAQKKVLIALADEKTVEFDEAYRRRHALGISSTLNSAKRKLLEDGNIERSEGLYTVADPFFAAYLRG